MAAECRGKVRGIGGSRVRSQAGDDRRRLAAEEASTGLAELAVGVFGHAS